MDQVIVTQLWIIVVIPVRFNVKNRLKRFVNMRQGLRLFKLANRLYKYIVTYQCITNKQVFGQPLYGYCNLSLFFIHSSRWHSQC